MLVLPCFCFVMSTAGHLAPDEPCPAALPPGPSGTAFLPAEEDLAAVLGHVTTKLSATKDKVLLSPHPSLCGCITGQHPHPLPCNVHLIMMQRVHARSILNEPLPRRLQLLASRHRCLHAVPSTVLKCAQ